MGEAIPLLAPLVAFAAIAFVGVTLLRAIGAPKMSAAAAELFRRAPTQVPQEPAGETSSVQEPSDSDGLDELYNVEF